MILYFVINKGKLYFCTYLKSYGIKIIFNRAIFPNTIRFEKYFPKHQKVLKQLPLKIFLQNNNIDYVKTKSVWAYSVTFLSCQIQ